MHFHQPSVFHAVQPHFIFTYFENPLYTVIALNSYYFKRLKAYLSTYLGGQLVFCQHDKNVILLSPDLCYVKWEITSNYQLGFLVCNVLFSVLAAFKIISLSPFSSSFNMMCLGMVSYVFILLGITWASWICELIVFIRFIKFLP